MSRIRDIANLFSGSTDAATDAEVASAISTHATATNGHSGRGTTANRPASPTVGDLYYDTDLKNLYQYNSTGWGIAGLSAFNPSISGGVLDSYSTYYYRRFTSTGTLYVSSGTVSVDILIVAGGGGGGGSNNGSIGGGGGAGGLQYLTSQSLSTGSYTVTVGGGGSAGTSGVSGTSGSNSVFGSLTASVGGGGGGGASGVGTGFSGGNGGSGGGAGFSNSTTTVGGTGTAGQGNAGGNEGSGGGGAGGGGAGSAGSNPSGGSGLANSITGTSITYASGGAGSGSAGSGVIPSNPIDNRGIGGDAGWNANGASGGSGIVIVRYLKSAVGE